MSKKKSSRGSLVKEISKKLPGSILYNDLLKDGLKELLKKYSGLYALYKGDKVYYIGLAKDLHKRINDHRKDKHRGKWDKFRLIVIKKVKYIKDLEAVALSISKPPGNTNIPRVPSSYHIHKLIKEEIKANEYALKKLYEDHKRDAKTNKDIAKDLKLLRMSLK